MGRFTKRSKEVLEFNNEEFDEIDIYCKNKILNGLYHVGTSRVWNS